MVENEVQTQHTMVGRKHLYSRWLLRGLLLSPAAYREDSPPKSRAGFRRKDDVANPSLDLKVAFPS